MCSEAILCFGGIGNIFDIYDISNVCSGFLSTYLILINLKKAPNLAAYTILRYLSLQPSIIATLCLTILFQRLGSGPLFHRSLTDPYVKPCYDYWWTHVLFINNFWTMDKMVRSLEDLIILVKSFQCGHIICSVVQTCGSSLPPFSCSSFNFRLFGCTFGKERLPTLLRSYLHPFRRSI